MKEKYSWGIGMGLFLATGAIFVLLNKDGARKGITPPSAADRCMYEGIPATPVLDGAVHTIAKKYWKKRYEGEELVVCALHSNIPEMVGSQTFHDSGNGNSVFIIWISDKVLKRATPKTLEFVLAHENGHHALFYDLCGDANDDRYLACEHLMDRYAAGLVGNDVGIKSLNFFTRLLNEEGERTHDIMLINKRIDLLEQDMLHPY